MKNLRISHNYHLKGKNLLWKDRTYVDDELEVMAVDDYAGEYVDVFESCGGEIFDCLNVWNYTSNERQDPMEVHEKIINYFQRLRDIDKTIRNEFDFQKGETK